ncbi:MAG: trypsin-like peptidase domain-containing protein [Planctomycetota bacterium]
MLCLLTQVSILHCSERLEPLVLAATKEATVYIKTAQGSGSGFLVKTIGKEGWIATNAHVVANTSGVITAVFGSGTAKERPLAARVVSLDTQRDIAILRVEGERMPKPLTLASRAKMEETMSVWIFGFPFGEALAMGNASPSPTITPTQVSSLRSDGFGNIEVIQTGGGINPGNSGGPIVNGSGSVIGIAVAKIRGAEIGFGIPAAQLEEDLAGRIISANPVLTISGDNAEVTITATSVDPLVGISKIVALVAPAVNVTEKLKADSKGRIIGPIVSGMTEGVLVYKEQEAAGTVKLRWPKNAGEEVVLQFRYLRKDGTTVYTNDLRCKAGTNPPAPGVKTDPGRPVITFTYTAPKVAVVTPPAEAAIAGTLERDANGRQFTAVTVTGIPVDLGKDPLQVAVHASGKEIYVIRKDEPIIAVVDPLTWATTAEIVVPESPTSIWADGSLIAVACGKSRVVALVDPVKRSLVASGTLPQLAKYTPDTVIGRAPDGSVMSLWQLDGGSWLDRALVHTTSDGVTRIMINGEPMYWATWLTNGTGIIGQGSFTFSPSGAFDLVFPQGPKNSSELHGSQILGGVAPFHTDSGAAFLTDDRKAVVWSRKRVVSGEDQGSGPWTYLLSPTLDAVLRDFPGCAITELPQQRLFITLGYGQDADSSVARNKPTCYYVSNHDGRIIRRITLQQSNKTDDRYTPSNPFKSGAIFIPGHEILLVPKMLRSGVMTSCVAYRCGPVVNAVEPQPNASATNDPPLKAAVGDTLKYTPSIAADAVAKDFRLKRPIPGMSIDAKTGTWTWRPSKEYAGRWLVTILATIKDQEATVVSWTIEVK